MILGKPLNQINSADAISFIREAQAAVEVQIHPTKEISETISYFVLIDFEQKSVIETYSLTKRGVYYVDVRGKNVTFKFFKDSDTLIQYTIVVSE